MSKKSRKIENFSDVQSYFFDVTKYPQEKKEVIFSPLFAVYDVVDIDLYRFGIPSAMAG